MQKFRLVRYISVTLIFIILPILTYCSSYEYFKKNEFPIIPNASAASSGDFGVASFVSSLPSNTNKQTVVNKTSNLGVGWAREEYSYSDVIDFTPYDAAYLRLHAANINILGLLTYTPGKTHAQWKNFVTSIVYHFGGVTTWEIMNEADNYLSPADYVSYLKEANTIIKTKNSSSKIILSGIGARVESPNFWNGVSAAGGWGYFDAVGLHVYHDGNPSQDSYNNGSLGEEIQHAIDSINNNGGGKKIWVTEFGWDSNAWGTDNQANWLSSGLETIHNYSEVEKIFVFRMYDQGNGFGLVNSGFTEKPSFNAVKDAIGRIISGQTVAQEPVSEPEPEPQSEETPISAPVVNKEKSSIRLDQLKNLDNGAKQYRIVVLTKDENDNIIKSITPKVTVEGNNVEITDFGLVGDEWFAYATSKVKGESTVKITAGGQVLGIMQLSFENIATPLPQISPSAAPSNEVQISSKKASSSFMLVYLIGGIVIVGLLTYLYFKRRNNLQKTIIQ